MKTILFFYDLLNKGRLYSYFRIKTLVVLRPIQPILK